MLVRNVYNSSRPLLYFLGAAILGFFVETRRLFKVAIS
jgi:hypothetical protein